MNTDITKQSHPTESYDVGSLNGNFHSNYNKVTIDYVHVPCTVIQTSINHIIFYNSPKKSVTSQVAKTL